MRNNVVIGASSGIGKSITNRLIAQNENVWATYNTSKDLFSEDRINWNHLDVLQDSISLNFIPDKIDTIVYCPGSINLKPFKRFTPQHFIDDYNLQVVGAIKLIQYALPALLKSSNPSIVFFSTVAVNQGFSFHTQVATSKGAIEGLTRSLAAEFAPNIRVNAVAPSLTNTPLTEKLLNSDDKQKVNASRHPLKRIGIPEDIAEMVLFLLSEKSTWITGQVFHVDGGMSNLKL